MLATCGLLGMVGGDGEWLTWMMLEMFSGVTTCGHACKELAIRSQMAKSILFRPSGSCALVEGGASDSMLSGPPLSGVDLKWVHPQWLDSREVAPQSQTAEL